MKINREIIQALIDNNYKTLNETGFINVNTEGKTEKQYVKQCEMEALNQLINGDNLFNKFRVLQFSSIDINNIFNINSDVMRDVKSINSKNIVTQDKETKECLIISNNGHIILKNEDDEAVIPFNLSKQSILLEYCNKVVNYSFYHCEYDELTSSECVEYLNHIKLNDKTDIGEYITNKLIIHDFIYKIENGTSPEVAYDFDIFNMDEEVSCLTIRRNDKSEIFLFEQDGKVTIIDFNNNSFDEYYEDEDFEILGEEFTAGAGVLETIEMQLTGLYKMEVSHREIYIEDEEPEVKRKNKFKP